MVEAAERVTPRQRRILIALCRDHALSGRPVASGHLCKAHGLEWSPATVRNELAALERAGLVHKPHAASGRVPTAQGWRIYIESLPRADARPEHRRLLDVGLGERGDPRMGLRSTARVLSELAGCVAVGFFGEPRPGVVRALELVPLASGEGRVLVMLGLEDGASSVRTVEFDRELLDRRGELRRIQGLLRELTVGRSLEQARDELRDLLAAQQAKVDRCMAEALRVGMLLCVASFDPLWMQVAGHGNLLGRELPGEREGEGVGELIDLLEDYQRLAEILCQLLPEPDTDPRASVCVDMALDQLGARLPLVESPAPRALRLTLVGCRLRWPPHDASADPRSSGPATGAVALLGSPRMDYEAVIPLVEYAARAMAGRG
jgi:heat-inducible transcriptional repressor